MLISQVTGEAYVSSTTPHHDRPICASVVMSKVSEDVYHRSSHTLLVRIATAIADLSRITISAYPIAL